MLGFTLNVLPQGCRDNSAMDITPITSLPQWDLKAGRRMKAAAGIWSLVARKTENLANARADKREETLFRPRTYNEIRCLSQSCLRTNWCHFEMREV